MLQHKASSSMHHPDGASAERRHLNSQYSSTNHAGPAAVPPIVHEVLCSPGQPLDAATRTHVEARFGHDFSHVRVHAAAPPIQAKLTINHPNDRYEQEADRVADAVMRMPEPGVQRQVEPDEEEETLQTKPLAAQITPLIQRQIEPEEREEEEEEEEIQPKRIAGTAHKITPEIERDIQSVRGAGQPLSTSERTFFEPRFGADFGSVRVHSDARAAYAARSVDARAFTVGVDVVFGGGEYSTGTSSGRRLLAHELAHVVQQNGGRNVRLKKALTPLPMSPTVGEPYIQREEAGPPPPPALPTLSFNPGTQLTRGQGLTATKSFTPTAGETLNITAWRYITPAHGTVTRPSTDADFQTQWGGTMALSGSLEIGYRITPAGGSPEPEATIRQDIAVEDRTGSPWGSQVTQESEQPYGGQPSPPTQFGNLGYHESLVNPLPNPASTQISSGPNTQFSYVSSLTPGTYISRPSIHPDLINTGSDFYRFHQDPSRLYLVVGTTRTLIPLSEYSDLSVSGGTVTFDVSDWEAFYKQYDFYEVTATAGGQTITLRNSWWGLDDDLPDADVEIRNDAAIRQALRISSTDSYRWHAQQRGQWEREDYQLQPPQRRGSWRGYELMQSADILAGTRSHEYRHITHSHRANFLAMMRALDPQRKIESTVSTSGQAVNFNSQISTWWSEILRPHHELVDEAASREQERFVDVPGVTMAGVNVDPDTGDVLGSVWNITNDRQMT